MLIHFILLIEVFIVVFFLLSYFFKKILLWVITFLLSGMAMFLSLDIEFIEISLKTRYEPFLLIINLMFFLLALFYLIIDLWDQYGFLIKKGGKHE